MLYTVPRRCPLVSFRLPILARSAAVFGIVMRPHGLAVRPAVEGDAVRVVCRDEGHRHLRELMRWSLVEYQSLGVEYGRYHLHDIVRIYAASCLQAGEMG